MSKQFDKKFKEDAARYYFDHKEQQERVMNVKAVVIKLL